MQQEADRRAELLRDLAFVSQAEVASGVAALELHQGTPRLRLSQEFVGTTALTGGARTLLTKVARLVAPRAQHRIEVAYRQGSRSEVSARLVVQALQAEGMPQERLSLSADTSMPASDWVRLQIPKTPTESPAPSEPVPSGAEAPAKAGQSLSAPARADLTRS